MEWHLPELLSAITLNDTPWSGNGVSAQEINQLQPLSAINCRNENGSNPSLIYEHITIRARDDQTKFAILCKYASFSIFHAAVLLRRTSIVEQLI